MKLGTGLFPLVIFSAISALAALCFGAASVDWLAYLSCLFSQQNCSEFTVVERILVEIRLPRILVGFAAGAGLTLAGNLLQSVTRNPLADPYLFGIVSGAGLGAVLGGVIASLIGITFPLVITAFLGALVAVLAVVLISARHGWQRIDHILLAGVAISFLWTAITSLLLYLQSPHAANRVLFWLMGSLASADWTAVMVIWPVVLIAALLIQALARQLDALLLSDDAIHALGISVANLRMALMLLVAGISAVIVDFCGGIGFVGLMVPHMVRHWFGYRHAVVNLACVFAGGSFLVWVDVLARSILPHQEIPIGIITAAIGSLFFIGLMARRSRL